MLLELLAQRLMAEPEAEPQDLQESLQELRSLLNRMLVERIKQQESLAIASVSTDPAAMERYRALQARRKELEGR